MNSRHITHLFLVILITAGTSCNNNDKSNAGVTDSLKTDSLNTTQQSIIVPIAKENDIIDTLNSLPFVKESSQYIDSITNHKHTIAYIIDTTDKEYTVTAGYNGADRFETYYNFTINKKTREIKVQDVISGDMVTPAAFEKLRKADK
ncbi:hypothetical protein [Ferruginibacter sp. SUN106]|uniref:hypothetical protein n=1 Tax=Ferruginibacter sp. SUN106 TaxID=2978348 RepID=UPI003D35E4C5